MTSTSAFGVVVDDAFGYRDRLDWLIRLRWWAMAGAMIGLLIAVSLGWDFVSAPGVVSVLAFGLLFNVLLVIRLRVRSVVGREELDVQALFDLLTLTALLAFAGGSSNPLVVIYAFHIVLGALLSGTRGVVVAGTVSVVGISVLFVLGESGLLPSTPILKSPPLLTAVSFFTLLGGLSYFALVLSGLLRSSAANAETRRLKAEANMGLLSETLDALSIGVEVFAPDGTCEVRNLFATTLRGDHVLAPLLPLGPAQLPAGIEVGREHVAVQQLDVVRPNGLTRSFDVLTLPPQEHRNGFGALLFVDRTTARREEERRILLERLATLGRALQGVAHELNTPLTTMQTLARDLLVVVKTAQLAPAVRDDMTESLVLLVDESQRCRSLTQGLLSTAPSQMAAPGKPERTFLDVVIKSIRLLGRKAEPLDPHVIVDVESLTRPCLVDSDRVQQIVMNLLQNAMLATLSESHVVGRIEVCARTDTTARVVIEIRDHGPGLPPEVAAHLFDPFVTTRPTGEGTGLGLYTSQLIARELGGEVTLESRPGGGVTARLFLPVFES